MGKAADWLREERRKVLGDWVAVCLTCGAGRRWFEEHAPNVHPVGRNGMHKYNNQDHSMYTAMLTVENINGAHHDIWSVNVEEEYHEVDEARADLGNGRTGRDAPIIPRRAKPAGDDDR